MFPAFLVLLKLIFTYIPLVKVYIWASEREGMVQVVCLVQSSRYYNKSRLQWQNLLSLNFLLSSPKTWRQNTICRKISFAKCHGDKKVWLFKNNNYIGNEIISLPNIFLTKCCLWRCYQIYFLFNHIRRRNVLSLIVFFTHFNRLDDEFVHHQFLFIFILQPIGNEQFCYQFLFVFIFII